MLWSKYAVIFRLVVDVISRGFPFRKVLTSLFRMQVLRHSWMSSMAKHAEVQPTGQFGIDHEVVDEELLRHVEAEYGFQIAFTRESLESNAFNHATATYILLEKRCLGL